MRQNLVSPKRKGETSQDAASSRAKLLPHPTRQGSGSDQCTHHYQDKLKLEGAQSHTAYIQISSVPECSHSSLQKEEQSDVTSRDVPPRAKSYGRFSTASCSLAATGGRQTLIKDMDNCTVRGTRRD